MCYVFVAFVISFTVSSTQWIPYLVKPRLNALVLFWWFYDWEIVMIWEFILMIFKSEDTVFLCHLLTACLLQLSRICLCFFFFFLHLCLLPPASVDCVSLRHQVLLSADTVLELNKTLMSGP